MSRDIDTIIQRIQKEHPTVKVEQLKVKWPADDDGIWFFNHPACPFEVQLESPFGKCPFLIETDESNERTDVQTVEEAIDVLCRRLHLTAQLDFC